MSLRNMTSDEARAKAEQRSELAARCGIEYGTNTDSPTDPDGIFAYITTEGGGPDMTELEREKVELIMSHGFQGSVEAALEMAAAYDAWPNQASGWYLDRFGVRADEEEPEAIRAAAGVPNALMGAMDSYEPTEDMVAYAFELSGNATRGAWLVGSDYATMAAAWVSGMAHGSRYVDVPELLADFEAMSRFGPEGARNRANAMRGPSVLVLNAIDGAQWTRQSVALVAPVIRYRRMASLPTVVTATTRVSGVASHLMQTISGDDARKQANDMLRDLLAGMGRTKEERRSHFIECGAGGDAVA
ncbi:MAG: hypothetical protein LKF78_07430 [Atopobiaceae bacterium]|jgi:hypothetical protein|nr:hypothetical protein [Atopobiaceae bacterium]MCH4276989.1 hypothetical protein [Atopobiaceae bacterium]MCI1226891.1 hypothetical protein [Atopobiaceae bacterium]MDD2587826.1 hypothetical protein [Atopobiaceae bacterium]